MHESQLPLDGLVKAKPVLKWAGGKQQMVDLLLAHVPPRYNTYIEPFFGGGALFFALRPQRAIIADSNPELINLYRVVATDVEALIVALAAMATDEELFYQVRRLDVAALDPIAQAARTIYLNRTCFNGLYRVNRKGQFNTPYGHYANPTVCDPINLRAASAALRTADIIQGDYTDVLRAQAQPDDLVFLDPPYLPISAYSDFKRYTKEQFYEDDHRELAAEVRRLHEMGCHVLLTNSNHPLVHELYSEYQVEVHQTRRLINKDATKRTGEDVLVVVPPRRRLAPVRPVVHLPMQMKCFPSTRFMGSKNAILDSIWGVASQFPHESVLDLFSGTGVVSYMFKTQGKRVLANDYMAFCATYAKALIENNRVRLSTQDVELLCDEDAPTDGFVSKTFRDLYYSNDDNAFIDVVRANIMGLRSPMKQALARAALVRACVKKRPRGLFTYTGHRYDDGRRDLQLTLKEHFRDAVDLMNAAVFDNNQRNIARQGDAMASGQRADLVYIDPPYFSPLSDNEYVRRYHFVEGLARDWQGVEIQEHTSTKKFKGYPTPFRTRQGAHDAFDTLFRRHRRSILLVSYASNAQPMRDEMLSLMARHKRHVEVVAIDHRYHFGNQGHLTERPHSKVQEYLFVGYE